MTNNRKAGTFEYAKLEDKYRYFDHSNEECLKILSEVEGSSQLSYEQKVAEFELVAYACACNHWNYLWWLDFSTLRVYVFSYNILKIGSDPVLFYEPQDKKQRLPRIYFKDPIPLHIKWNL